jgi:hypothetical protein
MPTVLCGIPPLTPLLLITKRGEATGCPVSPTLRPLTPVGTPSVRLPPFESYATPSAGRPMRHAKRVAQAARRLYEDPVRRGPTPPQRPQPRLAPKLVSVPKCRLHFAPKCRLHFAPKCRLHFAPKCRLHFGTVIRLAFGAKSVWRSVRNPFGARCEIRLALGAKSV